MKFKVTEVLFDYEPTPGFEQEAFDEAQEVAQQVLSQTWSAEDEDDLVDEVSWVTGFCVKSLKYTVIPDEIVLLKNGGSVLI